MTKIVYYASRVDTYSHGANLHAMPQYAINNALHDGISCMWRTHSKTVIGIIVYIWWDISEMANV